MSSRLRVIIEGESLFNDGVGAAVFTITLALLLTVGQGAVTISGGQVGILVAQGLWLLVGGPLIGLAIGYLVSHALGQIEDRLIETVATFLTAYGVYLIADLAHTSGLLAVVAAGLTLGSYGRRIGISESAREAVENVWDFVAYIVTSLLFLLLGASLGASLSGAQVPLILWATLGVVLARVVIVYGSLLPYNAFARRSAARGRLDPLPTTWQPLIVLSGLRGALSIALALSLPETLPQRDLIANVVYGVVLITLVGQGIGLRPLLPRWPGMRPDPRDESASAA
jgi:CPA1 family monovalent cation:H+ antiporter